MMNLASFLKLAGLMHVGLLWAGATMLFKVKLREHLASLPPFIRRLFWVYYSFIGLMLIGFGALTFLFAPEMATGLPLARGLCILLTIFWTLRLVAAAFLFDVRPYLTHWYYRLGYHATNLVFIYLVSVYAWTAWRGGAS
jgi:hypothetical protein